MYILTELAKRSITPSRLSVSNETLFNAYVLVKDTFTSDMHRVALQRVPRRLVVQEHHVCSVR